MASVGLCWCCVRGIRGWMCVCIPYKLTFHLAPVREELQGVVVPKHDLVARLDLCIW